MTDFFTIRLQFPNGRSEEVSVSPATTIVSLHDHHVSPHIPPGSRGQLFHMGRPLQPPSSKLADHAVSRDTVIQVFISRNVTAEEEGRRDEVARHPAYAHSMAGLSGFALVCAWVFFLSGGGYSDNDVDEWSSLDWISLICLLFLSALFLLSGALGNLL
ncbi:hypothetical protein RvY_11502 [Ramazzottius varieornatus]|uniref:Ubiquitin-like domain-containing protein n=1 Tax=Ramazzottius varieornatus TaxID=947166 RepID=A0A1D1VLQ6_RAMVA|nr:hypothetical protein RvY_11502 [Ramazzottius varieornatus]